jgi:hypothetical protein
MVAFRGLFAVSCGLALGCAGSRLPTSVTPIPATWTLVYVAGNEGTLERRDDTTLDWSAFCAGTCGQYVPSSGRYRLRGTDATSEPFSLPAPDLGRVVLRFDDDGHVWTHRTPRMPPHNPLAPLVLLLQVR